MLLYLLAQLNLSDKITVYVEHANKSLKANTYLDNNEILPHVGQLNQISINLKILIYLNEPSVDKIFQPSFSKQCSVPIPPVDPVRLCIT